MACTHIVGAPGASTERLSAYSFLHTCNAAMKDPKAIWGDDEVTDAVEDDIDDGREVPV